jgi:hypothetical protein
MLLVTGSQKEKQFISCNKVFCSTSILHHIVSETYYVLSWTHKPLHGFFTVFFKLLELSLYPRLRTREVIHDKENTGIMWCWYLGLCFPKIFFTLFVCKISSSPVSHSMYTDLDMSHTERGNSKTHSWRSFPQLALQQFIRTSIFSCLLMGLWNGGFMRNISKLRE